MYLVIQAHWQSWMNKTVNAANEPIVAPSPLLHTELALDPGSLGVKLHLTPKFCSRITNMSRDCESVNTCIYSK